MPALRKKLVMLVRLWVIDHIVKEDMKMKPKSYE